MKRAQFVNPNKMLMESGHKTFDRQTNLITRGNVYSNTQISSYIRPYNQTEWNGKTVQKGELQNYDLKFFGKLPFEVEEAVRAYAKDKSIILYMFFHRNSDKEKIVHGYVITDTQYRLIDFFVTGPTYKSYNVIKECSQYVVA
jgi:hypothetical protein